MHILINETQIAITNYVVNRNRITGQLVLTVTIPKENLTAVEIDELRTNIKNNAPTITVYNDNNEVVQTLTGFALEPNYGTKDDSWELTVENKSELEYQYQKLIEENEALKTTTMTLEEQNMMLTECLIEMSMLVYA